jgi:glutathione S-transferase
MIFHERIGLDGRRISPFSWRIRYALAHKGLAPEVSPTRFADVAIIERLSGQTLVPILEHDGVVISDSWSIACHLEARFPERPSLFGGPAGRGLARLFNLWVDTTLAMTIRRLIVGDFIWVLDPADRAYYRRSREAAFGESLETAGADRERWLNEAEAACAPLERTLNEQAFLCGAAPAYADYIAFSVFQWARIGSPQDCLRPAAMRALRDWRTRMVALHDGLGDRFAGYPDARTGTDGR